MATVQEYEDYSYDYWAKCLKKIYGLPASVTVITGDWKTGKTDFALHILEQLHFLGITQKFASNIKTEGDYKIEYVNDMMSLKAWSFGDKFYRKAYVYDEAIKSTPSRRSMSRINTEWLKFIPELSKGKIQLIVVTQEAEYTEGSFLHRRFIRGIWEKVRLPKTHPRYRKIVKLYSSELGNIPVFVNLPRCKTQFDPYLQATFYVEPEIGEVQLQDNVRLAFDYADGLSSSKLVNKYSYLHSRKEVMRRIRNGIKALKACYLVHNKGDGKRDIEVGNKQKLNNG